MNPHSACSRGFCRAVRSGVFLVSVLLGVSLSATGILLQTSQGDPHQYNGGDGFAWSVAFEVPEAVRVQAIQGWMRGLQGEIDSVGIFSYLPRNPFSSSLDFASFSLKGVDTLPAAPLSPPGRWEGVSSLNWDLQPGIYSIVFRAGYMPYGYGGPSVPPTDSGVTIFSNTYQTFFDDGWHDNGGPIGLRIYGAPLSAVPEPSMYGLFGTAMLIGVAAFQRRRGMGKIRATAD